ALDPASVRRGRLRDGRWCPMSANSAAFDHVAGFRWRQGDSSLADTEARLYDLGMLRSVLEEAVEIAVAEARAEAGTGAGAGGPGERPIRRRPARRRISAAAGVVPPRRHRGPSLRPRPAPARGGGGRWRRRPRSPRPGRDLGQDRGRSRRHASGCHQALPQGRWSLMHADARDLSSNPTDLTPPGGTTEALGEAEVPVVDPNDENHVRAAEDDLEGNGYR